MICKLGKKTAEAAYTIYEDSIISNDSSLIKILESSKQAW